MSSFQGYISTIKEALSSMIVSDEDGNVLENDSAIEAFVALSRDIKEKNGTIFLAGNGASYAIAQTIAFEALQNAGIRTLSASNASYITAIANDDGPEEIFNLQVKRMFTKDDLLITISGSGNSKNIVNTINTAKEIGGKVVTLSAIKEDNASRKQGDLNFFAKANTYSHAQIAHLTILNCWLDSYIEIFNKEQNEQKYIDRGLK